MIAMAAVCFRRTVYFADTCYFGDTVVNYTIANAYCYLLCRLDLWPTVYMHDRYGTFYSTSLPLVIWDQMNQIEVNYTIASTPTSVESCE